MEKFTYVPPQNKEPKIIKDWQRKGIFEKIDKAHFNLDKTDLVSTRIIKKLGITDNYLLKIVDVEIGIKRKVLLHNELEKLDKSRYQRKKEIGKQKNIVFKSLTQDVETSQKCCKFLEEIKDQPKEIERFWEDFQGYYHNKDFKNDKYSILAPMAFKQRMEKMKIGFNFNEPEKDVRDGIDAFIHINGEEIPCQIKSCNIDLKPGPSKNEIQTRKEIQDRIGYLEHNLIKVIPGSLADQIKDAQIKKEPWENSPYAIKITKEMKKFRKKVFIATKANKALEILIPAGEIENPYTGIKENQLNNDGGMGEWALNNFEKQFDNKVIKRLQF